MDRNKYSTVSTWRWTLMNRTKYWILLPVITCVLIAPVSTDSIQATDSGEGKLYLREIVEEAYENNPEILRVKNEWMAAQNVPSQAGSLPDPMLILGLRNVGFDELTLGDEMMSTASVSIGQAIPFPGKLGKKEEIARKDAERMQEKYNTMVLGIISQVKVAYFDYFFIERSIDFIRKNKGLLETFEKIAETRYEVGGGIQQDVLKAQVELSRLLERLKISEREREEVAARINRLLNRPSSSPLPPPADFERSTFDYELEELNRLALEHSPELKAEEKAVERDRLALSLARREYLPDFAISAGIANRGELDDIWEVRLGIEVPFYFWKKQRYGVREASHDLEASHESRQVVKEYVLYRIKSLFEMTKTSEELVILYEEGIIPQAILSLDSAIAGYGVGNVDFLALLDNLITLLDDELKYTRELTRFEINLSKLEEAVGVQFTGL
jgi:outer membrane protein TolC